MNRHAFLPFVSRPGRYIGCEFNLPSIDDDVDLRWALVFPDLYEIGMSHQGLQILYHILNDMEKVSAERCYCPAPDAESLMRRRAMAIATLETGRPLAHCDLIGITLPHELCYTNILTIFSLSGIEFLAADRDASAPIIIGGGTCGFNPEPIADLFDAILVGDGEEAITQISSIVLAQKNGDFKRAEIIESLAAVEGIYLPGKYSPRCSDDGQLISIDVHAPAPTAVKRSVLANLDRLDHLHRPLVPNARIVHDRLAVEVARGCTRGCRFCQAGITYRPVRERSAEQVMELAGRGIENSGFDEISLLSLSTGDYSCLPEVLPELMKRFSDEKISVAMPSMRVGTLTRELMDQIKKVRKTGFTLAPEAGSERLRKTINKGISEQDLLQTAEQAYSLGWNLIKLYFMIGLPTETDEDLEAIVDLVEKTALAGAINGRGRKKISVSVGTFVPKPHTPFQWEEQLSIDESLRRMSYLKSMLHKKSITLRYHDPRQSFLEGVFSRGDRRLSRLIIRAWEKGARLDSWSEHFNLDRWLDSAAETGLNLNTYLRRRDVDEMLPWSHIDPLVDTRFLSEEREKSLRQEYTPDCRYHSCQKCGLCDFETIMPIVHNRAQTLPDNLPDETDQGDAPVSDHNRYLVSYSRHGDICYLGHLDFLQIIQRGLRRANLKPHFSLGFNPSPKISFGPALPVGTASHDEFFLVDLINPIADLAAAGAHLDRALPAGLNINEIRPITGNMAQNMIIIYEIELPFELDETGLHRIEQFVNGDSFFIERTRKGRKRKLDIRPLVTGIDPSSKTSVRLELISRSGTAGTKPAEVLGAVFDLAEETLLQLTVVKISWTEIEA